MRRFVCWSLVFVSGVLLQIGCLHSPPAGLTRGVVEIKNARVREGAHPDQLILWIKTLTGVVIGEHTILTVAHTFEDEPDPDHPITIDGRALEYTIIADGWGGLRAEGALEDKLAYYEDDIQEDYVLLKTTEAFTDFACLVPLKFERRDELRNLYLVTRRKDTGEVDVILAKGVMFVENLRYIIVDLPRRAREGFYLSGSPLIGTYEDGTLVLVGILKGSGDLSVKVDGKSRDLVDQFYILPAYRIPFDLIAEP